MAEEYIGDLVRQTKDICRRKRGFLAEAGGCLGEVLACFKLAI